MVVCSAILHIKKIKIFLFSCAKVEIAYIQSIHQSSSKAKSYTILDIHPIVAVFFKLLADILPDRAKFDSIMGEDPSEYLDLPSRPDYFEKQFQRDGQRQEMLLMCQYPTLQV